MHVEKTIPQSLNSAPFPLRLIWVFAMTTSVLDTAERNRVKRLEEYAKEEAKEKIKLRDEENARLENNSHSQRNDNNATPVRRRRHSRLGAGGGETIHPTPVVGKRNGGGVFPMALLFFFCFSVLICEQTNPSFNSSLFQLIPLYFL